MSAAYNARYQDFAKDPVVATELAPNLYMITGPGGNIGLLTGSDGKLLVDTGIPPRTGDLMKVIEGKGGAGAPRMVIDTHWHGDHTGGNEAFAKAGASILSHPQCRTWLSSDHTNEFLGSTSKALPEVALPKLTFTEGMVLFLNGEVINLHHIPAAHTDSDILLHFTKSNVIHTGDLLFRGVYPFIDYTTGGTIGGMIKAADFILATADAETKIIPGHGPLGDRAGVQADRNMMADVVSIIEPMKKAGKTEAEVIAAKPTAKYDDQYGKFFINGENFTKLVYRTLP